MVEEDVIKSRINRIYRNHLILDYYSKKLLKNSLPNQNTLKKLQEKQFQCKEALTNILPKIKSITNRNYEINDYKDGIELATTLLKEFFYETKPIINDILKNYEEHINPLVEEFMINPLDQLKVPKLKYI